ncbi:MAG TPA: family 10 glycosylhydrolase [Bacillota bacterium]|nr:family 10 glycosylhydrolase [Bacillota bacterium]
MEPKENRRLKTLLGLCRKLALVFSVLLVLQVLFQNEEGKRPEIRGIWVTRSTLTSKESIIQMLSDVKDANLTDVFVQVNANGYAYYASDRLPPAVASFDPLGFVLEEAAKRDLRVHAWVNAFTTGSLGSPPSDPRHVLFQHPEWSTVDIKGVPVLEYPKSRASEALPTQYLEPGLPEVQRWVIDNCFEIVEKYPVAGIHLDFLRYPGSEFGYHPQALERFEEEHGALHLGFEVDGDFKAEEAFNRFRREQITFIIQSIFEGVKKCKRDVSVSAAVYPSYDDALNHKFQDWFTWLERGYADFVCPMIYTPDYDLFLHGLAEIMGLDIDQSKVAVGLGAYQDQKEGVAEKIQTLKEHGFYGFVLFSYDALKERDTLDF